MKYQACPPATLLRRLAAGLYDAMLLIALLMTAGVVAVLVNNGEAIDDGNLWFRLWLASVFAGFYLWFWTHGGQTLGMRAWRLRLIAEDGSAVNKAQALLRLPLAICAWLSLAGILWSLLDARGRSAHDILSGTLVIVEPKRDRSVQR